jgi:hypothetical protein
MYDPKPLRSTGTDDAHLTADPAVPAPVPRFDSELIHQWPLGRRIAIVILGLLIAAIACWPLMAHSARPGRGDDGIADALLVPVIALGLAVSLVARTRWVFEVDGISSREWWRTRRLPYAEIASCTANHEVQRQARGPTIYGVRITFRSTQPFETPLSLFVREGYPLNPAIVQRLKTLMPQLSARDREMLELASLKQLPRFA